MASFTQVYIVYNTYITLCRNVLIITHPRVDSVLQTYERPEVFKRFYPMGQCGVDKFGSPGARTITLIANSIVNKIWSILVSSLD